MVGPLLRRHVGDRSISRRAKGALRFFFIRNWQSYTCSAAACCGTSPPAHSELEKLVRQNWQKNIYIFRYTTKSPGHSLAQSAPFRPPQKNDEKTRKSLSIAPPSMVEAKSVSVQNIEGWLTHASPPCNALYNKPHRRQPLLFFRSRRTVPSALAHPRMVANPPRPP